MAHTSAPQQHRATQGFVANVTWAWRHPSATLIEVAWRWLYGAPLLLVCSVLMNRVLNPLPWRATGVPQITANELLTDPLRAAAQLAAFVQLVLPDVQKVTTWLLPVVCVAWIVISAAGRTLVLRRMDQRLRARWLTVLGLQTVRIGAYALTLWLWWKGINLVGYLTITRHVLNGGDPRILQYAAGTIFLTLGLFLLSGALNWILTAAPIVAMRDGTGVFASIGRASRAQGVRSGMVEINLVLSVVKIMLIVLAMAFSAFPLPFTTVVTDQYVLIWSGLVTLWYFATSDFFHVTRLHAFVQLLERRELTPAVLAASE